MQIGVEIGDARVVAALVDDDGGVRARAQGKSDGDLAGAIRGLVRQLAGPESPPAGIAASVPDAPAIAAALDALRGDGLAGGIAGNVIATGTAAAAAESWVGAGRGSTSVVFFAVGEHTTAGYVRNGVPLAGAHGRAMSVAWLALNPVEREDYRKVGCLETEVAAAGIVRRMVWRVKAGDRSRIEQLAGEDLANITIDHVLHAARDGDGVSISVMRDTAKYLGMAAANLVVVTDPDVLVLGGFMASAADLLLDPLRAELQRRLPRTLFDGLTIAPAQLGDDAAAVGAARLAAHFLQ